MTAPRTQKSREVGCAKKTPGQTECDPGDNQIMLVHPDWLSTLVQALGASEGALGIYFRPPPLLRLLRDVIKPHVVHVGTCEVYGVRGQERP